MSVIQHENSDALLLLGIIYASDCGKKQGNLSQIIRACDFIEHIIITYDELKGGLVRLHKNQHIIEVQPLLFMPSKEISQDFLKYKSSKRKSNAREDLEYVRNLINAKEWDSNINLIEVNKDFEFNGLNYGIYDFSCKNYLNG